MRIGRKTDQLVHKTVFKEDLDIPPNYSKDFQHTALLFEMLIVTAEPDRLTVGFDIYNDKFYAELEVANDFEEITVKKLESSYILAICSLAVSYFGKRKSN